MTLIPHLPGKPKARARHDRGGEGFRDRTLTPAHFNMLHVSAGPWAGCFERAQCTPARRSASSGGGGRSPAEWTSASPAFPLTRARRDAIAWTLRITAAALLIGHGGVGFALRKGGVDSLLRNARDPGDRGTSPRAHP